MKIFYMNLLNKILDNILNKKKLINKIYIIIR